MEQEFLPLIMHLLEAEISIVWQRDTKLGVKEGIER